MKRYLTTHIMISVHLLIIVMVIVIAAWASDRTARAQEQLLKEHIGSVKTNLVTLAETTDRNDADATTAAIIVDCPRRREFEDSLNRLATLSRRELIDAQQLFESCGSFYAARKALMVARLEREYEVYGDYVTLLSKFNENAPTETKMNDWRVLIDNEQTRSDLLTKQTAIQSEIIRLLISGATPSSKTVTTETGAAYELLQSLTVLDRQIDDIRSRLIE